MPDCVMVPWVASPLRWPSTFQTTPVLLALVTVAVNCCEPPPAWSVTVAGAMVTTGSVGTAAPQPINETRTNNGQRRRVFKSMRTISWARQNPSVQCGSLQQEGEALVFVDGLDRGTARKQVVGDGNEFEGRFDQPGALGRVGVAAADRHRIANQNVGFAQPEGACAGFEPVMVEDHEALAGQFGEEGPVPSDLDLVVLGTAQARLVDALRLHGHGQGRKEDESKREQREMYAGAAR